MKKHFMMTKAYLAYSNDHATTRVFAYKCVKDTKFMRFDATDKITKPSTSSKTNNVPGLGFSALCLSGLVARLSWVFTFDIRVNSLSQHVDCNFPR